jgi:hypothetical protein
LEGFRAGQRANVITHILVEIAGDLAHDRRRALWLQRADRAVVLAGPVVDDVTLIDGAGAGQFRASWANVNVALLIEEEVARLKVPSDRADLSHTNRTENPLLAARAPMDSPLIQVRQALMM